MDYRFYDSCFDCVLLFTQPASRLALPGLKPDISQNFIDQPLSLLWQLTPTQIVLPLANILIRLARTQGKVDKSMQEFFIGKSIFYDIVVFS